MRIGWRSALGIALSALLLVWALRGVAFGDVVRELRSADLPLFLLATAAATLIFPLRARRWRTILDPIAPGIPLGALWRATAVGMMVNNVVPARAGELARAFALTRETPRVGFSAAFASLAVDRTFDAIVLLLLMLVGIFDPAFPGEARVGGEPIANWAGGFTLLAVGMLTALYLVVLFPARIVGWYEAFARRVAPRFEARGRDALLAFAGGLGVLRSPARFGAVLWWTTLHWLLNAVAIWLGFRAAGLDLPYSAALFLQGLVAIGVAAPAAPGFFGTFEAFAKLGLAAYGVSATQAVSWAIGYHILTFIPITAFGGYYAARLGLHLHDLRALERAPARSDANAPPRDREPEVAPDVGPGRLSE